MPTSLQMKDARSHWSPLTAVLHSFEEGRRVSKPGTWKNTSMDVGMSCLTPSLTHTHTLTHTLTHSLAHMTHVAALACCPRALKLPRRHPVRVPSHPPLLPPLPLRCSVADRCCEQPGGERRRAAGRIAQPPGSAADRDTDTAHDVVCRAVAYYVAMRRDM